MVETMIKTKFKQTEIGLIPGEFRDSPLIKKGFAPIYNENTEIFILGSFPREQSLIKNEYYANSENDFWRILSAIFGGGVETMSYSQKIEFLLENKIGLWDIIESHEGQGSSDNKIKNPRFNEFNNLQLLHIKAFFLNGSKAYSHKNKININVPKIKLYSSSPSARMKRIYLKEKVIQWKEELDRYTLRDNK